MSVINRLLWLTTCGCIIAVCNNIKAALAVLEDAAVPDKRQRESGLCPNMGKWGCVNIHLHLIVGVRSCTISQ